MHRALRVGQSVLVVAAIHLRPHGAPKGSRTARVPKAILLRQT
jgi:hypothetical protein